MSNSLLAALAATLVALASPLAHANDGDAKASLKKGLEQVDRARFEEAITYLRDVLYPTPQVKGADQKKARFGLAQALFFTGKRGDAERELQRLLRVAPGFKFKEEMLPPDFVGFFKKVQAQLADAKGGKKPKPADKAVVVIADSKPETPTPETPKPLPPSQATASTAPPAGDAPMTSSSPTPPPRPKPDTQPQAPSTATAPAATAPREQVVIAAPDYAEGTPRVVEMQQPRGEGRAARPHLQWIPFGGGQFSNGDNLGGAAFLVVEAGLLAANISLAVLNLSRRQPDGGYPRDALSLGMYWSQQATAAALCATLVIGLLDGYLWSPQRGDVSVALAPNGSGLSLVGSFR